VPRACHVLRAYEGMADRKDKTKETKKRKI
jgi:hypothetical protein